jgi:hypothetical protein
MKRYLGNLRGWAKAPVHYLRDKLSSGIVPDPKAGSRTRWCLTFPPCLVGVFP